MDTLKNFITENLQKIHKEVMAEELAKGETPSYASNIYEGYKKDLEDVVGKLSEACNLLESCILKQETHIKTLPEVSERVGDGKKSKDVLLDIFKTVKKAKIESERKLYEIK